MATCTHEIGTADTGNTPNPTGAFTPALNDLLIVFVIGSATVVDAGDTVTNSAGLSFVRFASAVYNTGNVLLGYVSTALVSSATSQTITYTPTDTANGSIIFVCAVAGMTKVGANAIRQFATQDTQAAGTPAPAFSVAALTDNPTLGCVGNNSAAPILTPPTGWTEPATTGDISYAAPTTGGEYCFRDSGFTGTTVTWGSASATAFGSMIVELDTSTATPLSISPSDDLNAAF